MKSKRILVVGIDSQAIFFNESTNTFFNVFFFNKVHTETLTLCFLVAFLHNIFKKFCCSVVNCSFKSLIFLELSTLFFLSFFRWYRIRARRCLRRRIIFSYWIFSKLVKFFIRRRSPSKSNNLLLGCGLVVTSKTCKKKTLIFQYKFEKYLLSYLHLYSQE